MEFKDKIMLHVLCCIQIMFLQEFDIKYMFSINYVQCTSVVYELACQSSK